MKTAIVSYSMNGNNTLYASYLANSLPAEHIQIQTDQPASFDSIILDLVFRRKPKIDLPADALAPYDLVLFVAPVWMGQVAFPLRRCLGALRKNPRTYGFLSVSGGADGDNPKIGSELEKRTSQRPALVLDQHIRELLPAEPAPTREDTSNYRLSDADCERFASRALNELKRVFPDSF